MQNRESPTRDMYHLTVSPDTYEVLEKTQHQNPFIQKVHVDSNKAARQHAALRSALPKTISVDVTSKGSVPDLVYIASGGLSLPRLPISAVILPRMKYASRKAELPIVKTIFQKLGISTFELPPGIVFEGEAEAVWLEDGKILLHGYGHRSTKETGPALQSLLTRIYKDYEIDPPNVISIHLQSPKFYHIDMALLLMSPRSCLIHKDAVSESTLKRVKSLIPSVRVVQTSDPFALNAIVLEKTILTHKPLDPIIKRTIQETSGKQVKEVDISEFEKGGGAVACLVMEIFEPTQSSSP